MLNIAVAQKSFLQLKQAAEQGRDVHFIAISHSDKASTDKWLQSIGGAGRVDVQVDDQQQTFSAYGLGLSSFWAVPNPTSLRAAMDMGKEGMQIRSTESGSRWQEAGLFAVNGSGIPKYFSPSTNLGGFGRPGGRSAIGTMME